MSKKIRVVVEAYWPVLPMDADRAPFDPSLRGLPLLKALYNFIFTNQEQWKQDAWFSKYEKCGTAFCFGGWMATICGTKYPLSTSIDCSAIGIPPLGVELLCLSEYDVNYLFSSIRDLNEIYHFVETKLLGYDGKGFDRDGFNKDGVNSEEETRQEIYDENFVFSSEADLIP